jgi:hypothetical protein
MAGYQIPWVFTNTRTGLTIPFLTASINFGRATYMDVYNGGGLIFTIENNANEAGSIRMGDSIQVTAISGAYDVGFWVDEIQCQDYPGGTGFSTATIVCSDGMVRLGRRLLNNQALTLAYSGEQAVQMSDPLQSPGITRSGTGESLVSATTYTGAPMQRLNQLVNTERGVMRCRGYEVLFVGRRNLVSPAFSVSFGRTQGATEIGYQQFSRIGLGLNFMNTVAVTPTGGAEQLATNTASVTAYGSAYYSLQTEDSTNAQGLGLADWLSNSQADPSAERYEIQFSDRSQTENLMTRLLSTLIQPVIYDLSYRIPGAASNTTTQAVMEGFTIDISQSDSTFSISLSPATYYQFFTLDSATLGILDTSRLGW